MTPAQMKLVALDLKKAEITAYYEELDKVLTEVVAEVGMNGMFQSEDGTVFKITEPKGKYIPYKDLEYLRTKRADERAGTLSAKEAKEAGYDVK